MAPIVAMKPKVMTVKEVADYLRIHPSTVYRLLRKRRIPAFRMGSDWRFNVEEIDKWIDRGLDIETGVK